MTRMYSIFRSLYDPNNRSIGSIQYYKGLICISGKKIIGPDSIGVQKQY